MRNLSDGPCNWSEGEQPLVMIAPEGPVVSAHALCIEVDRHRASVLISATRDTERGVMHFVAQAEVSAATASQA